MSTYLSGSTYHTCVSFGLVYGSAAAPPPLGGQRPLRRELFEIDTSTNNPNSNNTTIIIIVVIIIIIYIYIYICI